MGKNAIVQQANTYLKAKTLLTLLVMEFDQDGWSARAYTPREFMREAGISRSGNQQKKFAEYWQGLVTAGVLEVRADGHFKVGKLFPDSGEIVPTTRVKSSQAVGKLFPGSGEIVPKRGNFPTSNTQSQPASLNQNQNLSESDILIDKSGLLGSIGVGANNYHLAEAWSFEELSALITEARSNAKIRNLPAFVVARLKERGSQRDFEKVRQEFERWIGHITPNMLQDFQRLISTYPIEQILDGIQECKYTSLWTLRAKLENWRVNGRKLPKPAIKIADPDEVVVGIPLWVRQKEAVSNGG